MVQQTKKLNCSISIFAAISLLLIVSLLFSLTEMCRMRVSKLYMQMIANSSIDSLFSLYHRDLWNKYHIFGLESFDDGILKNEYIDYLMPNIKKDGRYINNYYIASINAEDISYKKENLIDNVNFENEIISYMKYGIINSLIRFGDDYYDIGNKNDENKLYENINNIYKKNTNNELYQKIYNKYFNFKNDIVKLENTAKKILDDIKKYNDLVLHLTLSISLSESAIESNYKELNALQKKLNEIHNNLKKYIEDMKGFRDVVLKSRDNYQLDKMNYEDLDESIDEFINSEFDYFVSYVDENSDMNICVNNELTHVANVYNNIEYYVKEYKKYVDEIEDLEEEKKEISKDKDLSSSEKTELKKEINDELKDLYDEVKYFTKDILDDKTQFFIQDIDLNISKNGDLNKTSLFDKIFDFFENGFLSICLEGNEINELKSDDILYSTYNIDSNTNFVNKVLLSEYELNFFNFYKKDKFDMDTKSKSIDLEVERLICGKNNDKDTLTSIIERLLLIREGCNIAYLYSDFEKRQEARNLSILLFGAFSIVVQEAMFIVILSSWAMCQSFVDVYNILHEKKVPIMHDNSTFSFSIDSILNMSLETLKDNNYECEKGLDYVDYLRLLLLAENQEVINSRMVSIIQNNMLLSQANFDMRNIIYGMDVVHIFHCRHFFTNMMMYKPDNVKLNNEYKMKINTYYDYIEKDIKN